MKQRERERIVLLCLLGQLCTAVALTGAGSGACVHPLPGPASGSRRRCSQSHPEGTLNVFTCSLAWGERQGLEPAVVPRDLGRLSC